MENKHTISIAMQQLETSDTITKLRSQLSAEMYIAVENKVAYKKVKNELEDLKLEYKRLLYQYRGLAKLKQ